MLNKPLIALCIMLAGSNCFAKPIIRVIPAFFGGLKPHAIHQCYAKIRNLCSNTNIATYTDCIRPFMAKEPTCTQPLILLNLTPTALFNRIMRYPKVDVVYATVFYVDKPTAYYLIDSKGEFINTDFVRPNIRSGRHYQELARKYQHLAAWDIISPFPPIMEALPNNKGIRIILKRRITNLCRACETVATTEEAYDFSPDGKFLTTKLLKLTPVSKTKSDNM